MTVKPIDLQTNIGQMHEVARQSHAQHESLVAQMHHLDKEAKDKADTSDSRLDQADETQHATNRLDEQKEESRRGKHGKRRGASGEPGQDEGGKSLEIVSDQNLGRFIDVKK